MVTVKFNDVEEFLAELRLDGGEVERNLVRMTIRSQLSEPFVFMSVVVTLVNCGQIVRLDARCGEYIQNDENGREGCAKRARKVMEEVRQQCYEQGLEVRAGVLE